MKELWISSRPRSKEQQACNSSSKKPEVPAAEKQEAKGRKPGKRGSEEAWRRKRENREPGVVGRSGGAVNKNFHQESELIRRHVDWGGGPKMLQG